MPILPSRLGHFALALCLVIASTAAGAVDITNHDASKSPTEVRIWFQENPQHVDNGNDLSVTELRDGTSTPQVITYYKCTDLSGADCTYQEPVPPRGPIHVSFLIDTSGSMAGPYIVSAKSAAISIINNALRSGDSARLRYFSNGQPAMWPSAGPTTDLTALKNAVNALSTATTTPLFSTLYATLDKLPAGYPRYVISISDGVDNASTHTFAQVKSKIISTGAPIYAIFANGAINTSPGGTCGVNGGLPPCTEPNPAYQAVYCNWNTDFYHSDYTRICWDPYMAGLPDNVLVDGGESFPTETIGSQTYWFVKYMRFLGYPAGGGTTTATNPMARFAQEVPSVPCC